MNSGMAAGTKGCRSASWYVFVFGILASPLLPLEFPTPKVRAEQAANQPHSVHPQGPQVLTGEDLFRNGVPAGLVQFSVPDPTGHYLAIPRIAILRNDRLEIFKPADDTGKTLELEFSLEKPTDVFEWDELVTFDSGYKFPGVIIYGGGETSRDEATIVCYVRGRFLVVFEGESTAYFDLDFDGYPELIKPHYVNSEALEPNSTSVWAWNGEKYVLAITVTGKEFCTKQVLEAVRRIAAMRK